MYISEGIPFGFTSIAMVTIMRKTGLSLEQIGIFVAALLLPWALKWAWAPLVDLIKLRRFGGRKAWIVFCTTMMIVTLLLTAALDLIADFQTLLMVIVLNNIFFGSLTSDSPKVEDRVNQCVVQLLVREDLLERISAIGMDFNVQKQAATVWVKREGGKQWHAVDELVDMYDTPDAVRIITERYSGHRVTIYPDDSGGSRKTVDASKSDISLLESAGFSIRAHKTNPGVKDRINATNAAFERGILFVNSYRCPTVASNLEQQVYGKNGEPDKKSGVDHQNDATTYPIAYEFPINRPAAVLQVNFSR